LIAESSDMSSAPSAARSTGIRQVYVPVAPGRVYYPAMRSGPRVGTAGT
jgi:hypothetical protein